MVSLHSGTPLGVGTSHGHFGPQDTPRHGLGGSHHLPPYSILCATPPRLRPSGSFSRDSQVGVPKLSRNCPGWSPGTLGAHNSRLQSLIQTCSPRRDLSNDVLYSQFGGREEVDSQLLVVGSQTANLTPGPSFAYNLGYRCPNGHFRYLRFKTFPMTLRTPQCEVFWALLSNPKHSRVPEDSKSSLFPSVGIHPHTWPM